MLHIFTFLNIKFLHLNVMHISFLIIIGRLECRQYSLNFLQSHIHFEMFKPDSWMKLGAGNFWHFSSFSFYNYIILRLKHSTAVFTRNFITAIAQKIDQLLIYLIQKKLSTKSNITLKYLNIQQYVSSTFETIWRGLHHFYFLTILIPPF